MTSDQVFGYAAQWFALGILWLFIAEVLLGLVGFVRRFLG